jgi:hypothetical protein
MASPWRVNYNGGALETNGLVVGFSESWYLSPLAIVTNGFLYGTGDVWFNLDSEIIQNVTWTPCDCSPECD